MTYILPIPVPQVLVDERGIVPANDFGHSHAWLTFAPDGRGFLTSDLFYNFYRYDKADDRDVRALCVTTISPAWSIERVTALEDVTHALSHHGKEYVFNNDVGPPVATPHGELAFTTAQDRTIVVGADDFAVRATFDPLAGGAAGASDLVALPDGGYVALRARNRLAILAPGGGPLANGIVAGRALDTLEVIRANPAVDFDEYRGYTGEIAALDADRICVAFFVGTGRSGWTDHGKFRYVILDAGGTVVATLPLGEADTPYKPAAAPHLACVAHRVLDGWITRSEAAVHLFDRDGARIARIGLDDADDALVALQPLALLGAAPGGELVFVHRKHHTLVVTDPVTLRAELAPALAAAAAAYKAEYARLKKAVPFAGGRFLGWEARSAPVVAGAAKPKAKKAAAAPTAPLPEPPPARDPEQALAFSPEPETCSVYADWLGVKGDPLGEYIGAHCAIERDPESADRTARAHRATAIYAEHGPAWLARWNDPRPITSMHTERLCGLPAEAVIETGIRDPVALEAQLARLPIRKLTVRELVAKAIAKLGDVPALQRVAKLAISGDSKVTLGRNTIGWLTAMKLARLEELYLYRAEWTASELVALVDSMPRVRSLELYRCAITPDALARLAESPAAARIERLVLSTNPLGSAGLPVLARFPALREVGLRNCDIGDDVATGAALGALSIAKLDLHDNPRLGAAGLRAIVAACPELRDLAMPDKLTAIEIAELAPLAPRLGALDCAWLPNAVVDRLLRVLLDRAPALFALTVRSATSLGASLGSYDSVTSLALGELSEGDVANLAKVGVPGAYTKLDLGGAFVDDELITLARSPRAARVRHLTVASPAITERGIARLLELPAIEQLVVSRAAIGDATPLCVRPAAVRMRFARCEWKKPARAALEAYHRAAVEIF